MQRDAAQSGPSPTSFRVTSNPTVEITVYDVARNVCGQAEGCLALELPPGLYRVHLERGGVVSKQIVDHEQATDITCEAPPLHSPVPFIGAATSQGHIEAAREVSRLDTGPPLGAPPHTSRLAIFLRRPERDTAPTDLPSEPIAIHDAQGRPLTTLSDRNALIRPDSGYVGHASAIAPGTYRIRCERSHREVAITVPAGRAAHVFVADTGTVRLDELRVSLVPADAPFDAASPIWVIMECVIAALRTSGRALPQAARALLPVATEQDLCFALAAAHLLRRSDDLEPFRAVMSQLARYPELPDVAILLASDRKLSRLFDPRGRRRGLLAHPWRRQTCPVEDPPLLRASLVAALTRPELAAMKVPPRSALAQAARRNLHDSVWCTWSTRSWDERWILPTVDRLRVQDRSRSAASIARSLALPRSTVETAFAEIAATRPGGKQASREDAAAIPGYVLDGVLGRGARSTVFSATRQDGCKVALKMVPLRGRAECTRVLDALDRRKPPQDPHIITATRRGRLPGNTGIWLEMELCRGSVLDLVVEADAPLTLERVGEIAVSALSTLWRLHRVYSAHGNLKPGNLLVRLNGEIAIADRRTSIAGVSPATAAQYRDARFMSPGLLTRGGPAQRADDVWALAATLYFLLTLEPPRDDYAGQPALDAARWNPVISLGSRGLDGSKTLSQALDRVLSSDDRSFPPSAFGVLLELCRNAEGTSANTLTDTLIGALRGVTTDSRQPIIRVIDSKASRAYAPVDDAPDDVLQLPASPQLQTIHVILEEASDQRRRRYAPVALFGLSASGPFFRAGLSWAPDGNAPLLLVFELSVGIWRIQCATLACSLAVLGRQYMFIPATTAVHQLKVEFIDKPRLAAMRLDAAAQRVRALLTKLGHAIDQPSDGLGYGQFLELPAGNNPQLIYVKKRSASSGAVVCFALHEAGPYYRLGFSWRCSDQPLFVTFVLADGIGSVACAGLPHWKPHDRTQTMCIPAVKATYELEVVFDGEVAPGRVAQERSTTAPKFQIIVKPVSDRSGGGGRLGIDWSGGVPLPTPWS